MSESINRLNALCDSYELTIFELEETIEKIKRLARAYDFSGDQTLWRAGQDIMNILNGER